MRSCRKRRRPLDVQNDEQIAPAQSKDIEIEKAVANAQETIIPRWDPTENITKDYEDFYKAEGSFELRIDRFTEFAQSELLQKKLHKNQWRWSAPIYIRGVPWIMCADIREKEHTDEQSEHSSDHRRFLGLFLYCNKDSTNTAWNCWAKYTICVVAQKEDRDDKRYCDEYNFCNTANGYGWTQLISLNTLLDPETGFMKDDTVILRADVKAEMPHGIIPVDKTPLFSSSSYLSNFVFVIEGKEVHVQSILLSMHSQYFAEQFSKHKSVNKAVLSNIDYDEFNELLGVIYPSRHPITVQNIETIAKLAHVFKMTDLLKECEVFLMVNGSNFGRVKLLLVAHWYNLDNLKAKCIGQYKTTNDLKQLRNEPEFAVLDCRMKSTLLDKFVVVNTSATPPATNHCEASDQKLVSGTRASEILNGLISSTSVPPDAVLVVENNRIPIHKMYLSIHSEYFKAMFLGEFQEKHQENIQLEEVDYAAILELLAIIYPTNYTVTEENVEAILKLADRFIMPNVLDQCKKALKCSSKMNASRKLWLAQRYNFSDLQIEYAQQYKSLEDVKKLKAEPEYASLDIKTHALIFDSITS